MGKIDKISEIFLKKEAVVKSLVFVALFILALAFLGCTSAHQANNLNKLSNEEIEAYNNDPNHTNKIVCKTDADIGSRIPKRVCHMESSIDERARRDQQSLEIIQNRGIQNTRKGGG